MTRGSPEQNMPVLYQAQLLQKNPKKNQASWRTWHRGLRCSGGLSLASGNPSPQASEVPHAERRSPHGDGKGRERGAGDNERDKVGFADQEAKCDACFLIQVGVAAATTPTPLRDADGVAACSFLGHGHIGV